MEIDKLEAGRKLDKLVALNVMGWREIRLSGQSPPFDWPNVGIDLDGVARGLPAFSSDISAMWEVVEHFKQNGVQPLICWDRNQQLWLVWMNDDPASLAWSGETAPLATCRAALAAKKWEDNNG